MTGKLGEVMMTDGGGWQAPRLLDHNTPPSFCKYAAEVCHVGV